MSASSAPLALDDLEGFDPSSPAGPQERRFLCPMDACAAKPRTPAHRSLCVNVSSGAWRCWRCGACGKLREYWEERPGSSGRASARRAFALAPRAVSLSAPPQRPQEDGTRGGRVATGAGHSERQGSRWRRLYERALPLAGPPAAYLLGRGIPVELASAAGVRSLPDWEHWDKQGDVWVLVTTTLRVLFPIRSADGELVALHGRALDDGAHGGPKLTRGDKSRGVFATAGALSSAVLAVAEGPMDALSLALCGIASVALIGTSAPDWLFATLAGRTVLLATDADDSGDRAADELAARLAPIARVHRWRPAAKDWNAALLEHGAEALRAAFAERLAASAESAASPSAASIAPPSSEPAPTSMAVDPLGLSPSEGPVTCPHNRGRTPAACGSCLTSDRVEAWDPAAPPSRWTLCRGCARPLGRGYGVGGSCYDCTRVRNG